MDVSFPPPDAKRSALVFIYMTVFLDVLAMGIVGPVLPHLLRDFCGGNTAEAAGMAAKFATCWALMQLLASPMVGSLSDHFGRRPVVLLSNIGQGLDYILLALAPTVGWLLVGRLISGITAASIATGGAYIADVTPKSRRAAAFGWLGAVLSLGLVAGPATGGILGEIDRRLPFWVAGGLCLSNAVYGAFVLPESLPPHRRTRLSWRRINPLAALHLLRTSPAVFRLAAVMFLFSAAHQAIINITSLYTLQRYGWGPREVGLQLAGIGLCGAFIQACLVGRLTKQFGELKLLQISIVLGIAGFCWVGLSPTAWLFCLAAPLLAMWNAGGSVLQALLSGRVAEESQGQLQGAQSSVWGLAGILAPPVFAHSFAMGIDGQSSNGFLGLPYFLAAMGLLVAWFMTRCVIAGTR